MSDQEIRALERQVQTDPADANAQIKLFTARRRAGVPVESYYRLLNIKTGKYYQYWARYYDGNANGGRTVDTNITDPRINANGFFKTREMALREVKTLHRHGVELANYQLVEFQTMTLEIVGPILSTILDQIEVELLHAKKEQQLRKLQKLETEEQELLKKKTLQEKAKLQKLEAKEADLREKLEAKESKKKVKETK
jgi:hypothetical protein